jgi:exoribonuclease R
LLRTGTNTQEGDYRYSFDEETLTLLGRRRQRIVQVGDRLQVRLLRADVLQRTLDFEAVRWLS